MTTRTMMIHGVQLTTRILLLTVTLAAASTATAQDAPAAEKQTADAPAEVATTELKLRALTLQVPKTWEKSAKSSSMRLATLHVPAAEGDSEKGELAISSFGGDGGGIIPNVKRWIDQFRSEGRVHKVTEGRAGDREYVVADISGTYNKPVGPPVLRKSEPAPGYRMLAVIITIDGNAYFLKLTGPDATVKAQAEALRKSFGGSMADETAYEF